MEQQNMDGKILWAYFRWLSDGYIVMKIDVTTFPLPPVSTDYYRIFLTNATVL
jgi:hypothetical protein